METSISSWGEYRRLVISELERLARSQVEIGDKLDNLLTEQSAIIKEQNERIEKLEKDKIRVIAWCVGAAAAIQFLSSGILGKIIKP